MPLACTQRTHCWPQHDDSNSFILMIIRGVEDPTWAVSMCRRVVVTRHNRQLTKFIVSKTNAKIERKKWKSIFFLLWRKPKHVKTSNHHQCTSWWLECYLSATYVCISQSFGQRRVWRRTERERSESITAWCHYYCIALLACSCTWACVEWTRRCDTQGFGRQT